MYLKKLKNDYPKKGGGGGGELEKRQLGRRTKLFSIFPP
jgi:hypothetical protein